MIIKNIINRLAHTFGQKINISMKRLTSSLYLGTLTLLSCAQLDTSNPNNPYDQFGHALRLHVMATNARFSYDTCANMTICWADWGRSLSDAYHTDLAAFEKVNTEIIRWEERELTYMNRMKSSILKNFPDNIEDIIQLENDLVQDYQGAGSSQKENQKALLLLAANIKYVLHAFLIDGINAGHSSGITGWSDAAFNDCMVRAIENANIIDILVNWGAGPGGWVLGTAIDCARRQL